MIEVRRFRRSDRDQVAQLANAHIQAVLPGFSISVNSVMKQLEGEPAEFIVDPWVRKRATLVAVQRQRVAAVAHIRKYGNGDEVGESYRDAGEIYWLLSWPDAPFWPDAEAGERLMERCLGLLKEWSATRIYADGALPSPGIYGIPDSWPHIRKICENAGFIHRGHTEVVFVASIEQLVRTGSPEQNLTIRREVAANGTRFVALLDGVSRGLIEADADFTNGGTLSRLSGWADIKNVVVEEPYRRRGFATWLLGQVGEWLGMGGVRHVLTYINLENELGVAFLQSVGFRELSRTQRGWMHQG